jgi:hypothetical protein
MKHFEWQKLEHEHGLWLPLDEGLWTLYRCNPNVTAADIAAKIAKESFDGNGYEAEEFYMRVAVREADDQIGKSKPQIFEVFAEPFVKFEAKRVKMELMPMPIRERCAGKPC